jgi:hypothetical protein
MASVFCSLVTETVPVGDETVTIRKLTPSNLRAAQKANQRRSLEELHDMGGPAFLKELRSLNVSEADVEEATETDPLLLYDRTVLLEKGLVSWTFEREMNADAYEDLDEETHDQLARAILRLAKPSLFQSTDEQEVARKNDSPSLPAA